MSIISISMLSNVSYQLTSFGSVRVRSGLPIAPEATRVDPSRSPRPLDAPSGDQSRPRRPLERPEGLTSDDSETIWGRSGEVRSAWRIGRGGSRSTFGKIDLFRFGDRLWVDFDPLGRTLGSPLALSGRSFGGLGRSKGWPWGPQGRSWWPLRAS